MVLAGSISLLLVLIALAGMQFALRNRELH
jgi:hypothetical protein